LYTGGVSTLNASTMSTSCQPDLEGLYSEWVAYRALAGNIAQEATNRERQQPEYLAFRRLAGSSEKMRSSSFVIGRRSTRRGPAVDDEAHDKPMRESPSSSSSSSSTFSASSSLMLNIDAENSGTHSLSKTHKSRHKRDSFLSRVRGCFSK